MHRRRALLCLLGAGLSLYGCGQRTVTTSPGPTRPTAPSKPSGRPPATQRPYTINGKTYYPIPSADGFEEIGLASWYGKDFHGKPTANGEIYDMYAMTAAHKTLPIGTQVEVTNLENGNIANVRINDRGPFVQNRVIDMSYSGAKALDMLGKGVVKVRLRALTAVAGYEDGRLEGRFFVQVGSFVVRENAMQLEARLRARGFTGRVQQANIGGKRFYRVQIGVYSTLDKAQTAGERLKAEFPGAFVIAD